MILDVSSHKMNREAIFLLIWKHLGPTRSLNAHRAKSRVLRSLSHQSVRKKLLRINRGELQDCSIQEDEEIWIDQSRRDPEIGEVILSD